MCSETVGFSWITAARVLLSPQESVELIAPLGTGGARFPGLRWRNPLAKRVL